MHMETDTALLLCARFTCIRSHLQAAYLMSHLYYWSATWWI